MRTSRRRMSPLPPPSPTRPPRPRPRGGARAARQLRAPPSAPSGHGWCPGSLGFDAPRNPGTAPPLRGAAHFAIVSLSDDRMRPLQNLTWGTVSAYAARHGYTARQLSPAAGTKLPIHFAKYSEMLALMDGGYEWLVWLDADVAITNPNVTLESIIAQYAQPTTSLIVARDPWSDRTTLAHMWCPINSGVFFVRVTDWSRRLLRTMVTVATMKGEHYIAFPRKRRFDPGGLIDQPVLTQLLLMEGQLNLSPTEFDIIYRTEYHPHVSIVPGRAINSVYRIGAFYNDHPETAWRPGDWVAHVTGEKNQSRRLALLADIARQAEGPAPVVPALTETLAVPPSVERAVREASDALQGTALSLRQAQLIGTAIHEKAAARGGAASVLVWCAGHVPAYAPLWAQLNPKGQTALVVDPSLDAGAAAAAPDACTALVANVTNVRPSNSDRVDLILAAAARVPCTPACTAARIQLTLLLPAPLRHPWDVIVIDDPLATGPTHQMVFTAAHLMQTGARDGSTDVILLNAERRTLRRYSDGFLGTASLYNTYACPTPSDPDCPGSYLMHWRGPRAAWLADPADAFVAAETAWRDQRAHLEALLDAVEGIKPTRTLKSFRIVRARPLVPHLFRRR
eukprot:TRINITY_DN930_c0_g1_i1.p1 TRINITY_DN930_c0_g1~~TRINITY_DN930_c0_g1_i1.p1  ORF type:complete len:624 (-),score=187.27 TRINITY_DN930_c0_g1_i1:300-2171(-)